MSANETSSESSGSEESRPAEGLFRDLFYAWVGHASFLLNWPRTYYDECVAEGKRCVDEGRRRAKQDTGQDSS